MTSTRPTPRSYKSAIAIAVATALGVLAAPVAMSDTDSKTDAELQTLRDQVNRLQHQLDRMQAQQTAAAPAPAAVTPVAETSTAPSFHAGPVTVTLGGFVELMGIARNRNEAADWASNFNTSIPFPNSHNYDLSEFHETERQSRISALAQGPADENYATEAYVETDFGGATTNGNNNQSASFAPRVRHFYADYQNKTGDWNLLFGQTWSLVTAEKQGMMPRQENIPLTIDGQYIPGFDWLRVSQVRLVKQFSDAVSFGVSLENPAAQVVSNATAGAPAIPSVFNTAGASNAFSGNITTDYLPDVVAKLAFDPGWGHYEVFGLNRWFRSRYTVANEQQNEKTTGTGFGGSMLLPLVPKMLDFQASVLAGRGVGRYGSSGLPDVTVNPVDGSLQPLRGFQALAGLILRPAPQWTLFAYAGKEEVDAQAYDVVAGAKTFGYGYGNVLFDNSGCEIEGAAACAANTSSITSGTLGGWWKFYQGGLGNMQVGLTDTYIRRAIFAGVGGDPTTSINIALVSFRYYPYQR